MMKKHWMFFWISKELISNSCKSYPVNLMSMDHVNTGLGDIYDRTPRKVDSMHLICKGGVNPSEQMQANVHHRTFSMISFSQVGSYSAS